MPQKKVSAGHGWVFLFFYIWYLTIVHSCELLLTAWSMDATWQLTSCGCLCRMHSAHCPLPCCFYGIRAWCARVIPRAFPYFNYHSLCARRCFLLHGLQAGSLVPGPPYKLKKNPSGLLSSLSAIRTAQYRNFDAIFASASHKGTGATAHIQPLNSVVMTGSDDTFVKRSLSKNQLRASHHLGSASKDLTKSAVLTPSSPL